MSDPTTTSSADVESMLERVDPATLIVAANVRSDAALSREFVASIRTHGVLTPIRARRTEAGELAVIDGQRRALAACEAGLSLVPVVVADADADSEAARIIEQVTLNDQRAALTEADRIAAVAQLSLLGLSAGQIAKSVAAPLAATRQRLAIADKAATSAVVATHQATLD